MVGDEKGRNPPSLSFFFSPFTFYIELDRAKQISATARAVEEDEAKEKELNYKNPPHALKIC